MSNPLKGRSFEVDLGPFAPRLTFIDDNQMRLQAQIGPTTVDEVLAADVTTLRPNLYVVTWTESGGNFIVQVQDHDSGTVINRARLADGQMFNVTGTIRA